MIYVINGRLKFTTDARRDAAMVRMQTQVDGLNQNRLAVPFQMGPYERPDKGWSHALAFDIRLTAPSTLRDNIWNLMGTILGQGVDAPTTGATLTRWDSNADDENNSDQSQQNLQQIDF